MQKVYSPDREQAGPKYDCRKPLTNKEIRQIKRKLNLPQAAPLPKCPAKSKKALNDLAIKGESWHKDKKHAPCVQCTCPNTAGLGTTHYGYGWCHLHERGFSEKDCKQMADADLIAHQQRHPRAFRDAGLYLENVEKEGEENKQQFDLTNEMDKARALSNKIHERISAFEDGKDKLFLELECIVNDMHDQMKKRNSLASKEASQEDVDKIMELDTSILKGLAFVARRIACPLTEKGKDGPVEMSDATRLKLQMEAFSTLTTISANVQKLKAISMITAESFKEWLGIFLQELKKEFGTGTYTRKDGTFPIIEGVGNAMFKSGEPKKGV